MASDRGDEELEEYKNFGDMKLDEKLTQSLVTVGLKEPTLLQKKIIVPMTKGYDMLIGDAAGTGKSVAINIALLQLLLSRDRQPNKCQALLLSPTREVALRDYQNFILLNNGVTSVKTLAFTGGISMRQNLQAITEGVDVIFGTPGRVAEAMLTRKILDTDLIKLLVLDEADEIIDRGHRDAILDIRKKLNKDVQVIISTTVVSAWLREVADIILNSPIVCTKFPIKTVTKSQIHKQ